jgi:hypothetical protein
MSKMTFDLGMLFMKARSPAPSLLIRALTVWLCHLAGVINDADQEYPVP